ncbi:hypothetical protein VST7929_02861 [Vibrio stylophorae]|uniref:SnoaL-like domain-containing protein n=1 Tax=Vibrio stylophorae TaxID=659351 RepID=A0ABM8ZX42_9VIBR|nr:nuclear transport factor 2 family protein [Vibrio stylophorae]CAH0535200.1 hypothetical protein VST7929_02861 [Vibrio stylophorae]
MIPLDDFIACYQSLNRSNLAQLKRFYAPNVRFIDPAHEIQGLAPLMRYFESMYDNVIDCQFVIAGIYHQQSEAMNGEQAESQAQQSYVLRWQMQLQHPKLNRGQLITVDGMTELRWAQELVVYHRDYFDLGAMLYEHLPLIGKVIGAIKRRLGQ